eukprot:IDg5584t1
MLRSLAKATQYAANKNKPFSKRCTLAEGKGEEVKDIPHLQFIEHSEQRWTHNEASISVSRLLALAQVIMIEPDEVHADSCKPRRRASRILERDRHAAFRHQVDDFWACFQLEQADTTVLKKLPNSHGAVTATNAILYTLIRDYKRVDCD